MNDSEMKQKSLEKIERKDSSRLLESFFIIDEKLGKFKDNYVQVTENFIKVFDRDMKLRLIFEGLNIREC